MDLINQVCDSHLAKRLKDLRVEQIGVWGYFQGLAGLNIMAEGSTLNGQVALYSAFTVAELGDMLPDWVFTKKNSGGGEKYCSLVILDHVDLPQKWNRYNTDEKSSSHVHKDWYAETEADARAKMLIHLLEEKLIIIEDLEK